MCQYSHTTVIVCSFLFNLVTPITLLSERYLLKQPHPRFVRVLFFPMLWTGLFQLLYRFGRLGDYFSLTSNATVWSDFGQIASLGGRPLIDFIVALFGTCLLEVLPANKSVDEYRETEDIAEFQGEIEEMPDRVAHPWKAFWLHPMTLCLVLLAALLSFGGIATNIQAKSFYQADYPNYVPKKQQVGCVIGSHDLKHRYHHDEWFDMTESLAESGSKLVLWSELTAHVYNRTEEDALIRKAKKVAIKRQIYLGITYSVGDPTTVNKLVFVTKNGDIGIDYNKAHPVPGAEPQAGGPNKLQYVDTEEFGRVGGAICFDYSFTSLIGQASKYNVDLMLQPSWDWGPIGTYHEQGNMLRNVENGFTRLRCASQSISGVTEATLNSPFNQRVASLNNDKLTFYLPLRKRVRTLYSLIGNLVGYLCLAGGLSFLLATFIKRRKERQVSI
ncbi:carbon-nitrogen hydrolase [Blakeslea trispora]|nr:carbon-nitrogen hydrolase [Blakeslea trispora]